MPNKSDKSALATAAKVIRRMVRVIRVAFKAARRGVSLIISGGIPLLVILCILVVIIIAGSSAASLGTQLAQLAGISKKDVKDALKGVDPKLLKEIKKKAGDDVYAAFDCSNYSPSARKPGVNCIPGLLASLEAEEQGPVPSRAAYLLPAWQAAANRYQVPWQLIAAVNATRTDFGWIDCTNKKYGTGFYRIMPSAWDNYAVNAGNTPLQKDGVGCYKVPSSIVKGEGKETAEAKPQPEAVAGGKKKKKKKAGPGKPSPKTTIFKLPQLNKLTSDHRPLPLIANPYDPVDSAFTTARMLAANGAFKAEDWNYSGSPSNDCTTKKVDGRIWYLPETGFASFGSGAKLGFNSKLEIPRSAVLLAAKYRSNEGKYKPRRADTAEDDKLGYHPMPKKDIVTLMTVAWSAFGVRGSELTSNVTKNFSQVSLETGGRPYIMQSVLLIDGNENNPAGGLFGFIPETFDHWKVDGFDDRFNPLDNILAAVNAQINGPHTILDGSSGWSVPLSDNPYATGGSSEVVGPAETGKPIKAHPYNGKPQTDRVSKAVFYRSPTDVNSACYVAVVNDWYEAIKAHPPPQLSLLGGDIGNRIVQVAQEELAKSVYETGSDNVPRYHPSNQIAPYNINTVWCAAFASWVWYTAGLKKEMTSLGGITDKAGLSIPTHVDQYAAYGKSIGTYHTDNPQPGDLAVLGSEHVEIVEKVSPSGQVISFIGGNTSDGVTRDTGFSPTYYVSPPNVDPTTGGTEESGSFSKLEDSINGDIGLSVSRLGASGTPDTYGSLLEGHAWSSMKVPLLVTLMRERNLSSSEKSSAEAAITASDNAGAAALFNALKSSHGGLNGASKAIEKTLAVAGDTSTSVATAPPPAGAVSTWGQTQWSAANASKFYRALANGKLLNPGKTDYVLGLMEHVISDQQWGLGSVDFEGKVAIKAGWGPESGGYLVRQSGIIRTGHGGLVVTMIAKDGSGTFEAGVADLDKIAKWVNGNFDSLMSG